MKALLSNRPLSNARGRRDDGASTRAQILEAAGEIFGEKGFDRATGKEIADHAGTNSAAINYYFGGIAGLYEEVLVAAHQRLVSYEALEAIASQDSPPHEKLRQFVELVVGSFVEPRSSSWVLRVLSREILAPSSSIDALKERQLQPKKLLLGRIVSEIMGLPPEHPAVSDGCFNVIAPCLMLLVADRSLLTQMFPMCRTAADDRRALVDQLVRFSLAGLTALARPVAPPS